MKPIKTVHREPVEYREVEKTWTYDKLLELYDGDEIVGQLARRCLAFELAVAEWKPMLPHVADAIFRRVEELEERMNSEESDGEG